MCGICGTYGYGDETLLKRMCRVLTQRGSDEDGWKGGETFGLGSRRLKVIDLETGRQPIGNEDGTIWVVLNGEIYNYQELRRQLEAKGHRFSTRSDTEVIAHAYEEEGEACLHQFRGVFGLAVWDAKRERLLLARDRVGVRPLYYRTDGSRLEFASELKAILETGCPRTLNYRALHQYLSFVYIPAPNTIFEGISELPPGHLIVCESGRHEVRRYWDLPRDVAPPGDPREVTEEVRRRFEESVRYRLVSDVPVGVFLSGGIDSSAIVAVMARHMPGGVNTFTLGFDERHYDELVEARRIARIFGTEHREFPVRPDVIRLLPRVVWHFDQPFANGTALLIYQLSEAAKRHVTVALAGTGGDEAFAGYTRYAGLRWADYYARAPRFFREAVADLCLPRLREGTDGRHRGRRLRSFVRGGVLAPVDRYVSWVTYFTEDAKRGLYSASTAEAVGEFDGTAFLKTFLEDPGEPRFNERVFRADVATYLPSNQLHYSDRMSMAHGLELRVPFCDHELLELSAAIPFEWKTRGVRTKALLRNALSDLLPRWVLRSKKVGLNPPVGIWLKGPLRPVVRDVFSADRVRARGTFRPEAIEALLAEHDSGRRDCSMEIWMLLVFEVWQRVYLDGTALEEALPEAAAVC